MSRTACCFLALGIGVTLVAACGDDDVDFTGMGGSAGRGGTAGAAGAAGRGGSAGNPGNGGSAGNPGNGGSAGSPGNGGTGGSAGSPGNGGTGGTGGSDIPDGGPDGSTPLPDGGGVGDCPDFVAGDIVEQNGQNVIISRVVFENGGATVTFRGVNAGTFNFADPMQLCGGPEEEDCVSVSDLDQDVGDDALTVGEEETIFVPSVSNAGGELALISNFATIPEAFPFVYVAWGTFASIPPSEGGDGGNPVTSLEDRALATNPQALWTEDDRIDVGDTPVSIDTIVATGNTAEAGGFEACTGD